VIAVAMPATINSEEDEHGLHAALDTRMKRRHADGTAATPAIKTCPTRDRLLWRKAQPLFLG
jgi:hypothetical protein